MIIFVLDLILKMALAVLVVAFAVAVAMGFIVVSAFAGYQLEGPYLNGFLLTSTVIGCIAVGIILARGLAEVRHGK